MNEVLKAAEISEAIAKTRGNLVKLAIHMGKKKMGDHEEAKALVSIGTKYGDFVVDILKKPSAVGSAGNLAAGIAVAVIDYKLKTEWNKIKQAVRGEIDMDISDILGDREKDYDLYIVKISHAEDIWPRPTYENTRWEVDKKAIGHLKSALNTMNRGKSVKVCLTRDQVKTFREIEAEVSALVTKHVTPATQPTTRPSTQPGI